MNNEIIRRLENAFEVTQTNADDHNIEALLLRKLGF